MTNSRKFAAGVVLNIETAGVAEEAARAIEARVRSKVPNADIEGFAVQPMVLRKHARELILRMNRVLCWLAT